MRKRWNKEEDKELLSYILKFVEEGNSLREAVKLASEEINRTFESCYARWNNFLRIEYEDRLETAKSSAKENGNVFYEKWTSDDDEMLADIILNEISNGSSTRKAVNASAKKLNRSFTSCYNRWQTVVSKRFEQKFVFKDCENESNNDLENLKERFLLLENNFHNVLEQNEKIIAQNEELFKMLQKEKGTNS
ncbi:gp84 [Bacillus phage G]|uniref:Gp84 n=1 Tax=Bacillus phage G TaxID=2884420 RepID=G3MBF4_9CAUD|nr:gp84 [Bacillus phage G]AEO93355.1 gp84 [Bacillus phage G]